MDLGREEHSDLGNLASTMGDQLLGQLAIEDRLLTPAQLTTCLQQQAACRARGENVQLIQILLQRRILDGETTSRFLRRIRDLSAFKRYEFGEKLGEGAMAEVYRARDLKLGRHVAVKILRECLESSEVLRARFAREVQVVARLSHPNVVKLYDAGEENGKLYLVMELVEGRPLGAYLERHHRQWRRLAEVLEQVARGIHHAHVAGIVHRDLKPGNILVTADGHARVADFGLAHLPAEQTLTRTGSVVGTPQYMAPELFAARKGAISPQIDVYSLGAILYESLTRKLPHQAESMTELLAMITCVEPVAPRKFDYRIPADLETITLKALEKEPQRRYADAEAMAEDLRRWRDGEPILAHPPSMSYRLRKKIASRKGVLLVGGIGLAAVALTLGIIVPRWRNEQAKRKGAERAAQAKEREAAERERRQARAVAERERRQARATAERETSLRELGGLSSKVILARAGVRQGFRKPGAIRRDLEQAVAGVSDYIRRNPDHPQGYFVRSRARLHLDDLDGAESDARRALIRDTGFSPGWALLGRILLERHSQLQYGGAVGKERRRREAHAALREAQRAFRKGWSDEDETPAMKRWGLVRTREDAVHATLARAFQMVYVAQQIKGATQLLRSANEEDPSEEYCRWLGHWSTDLQQRLRWFELGLRIAPNDAWLYLDRGVTHEGQGDRDAAKADYSKAIQIDPRFRRALLCRTALLLICKEYEAALRDATQLIALDPAGPEGYAHRALARWTRRDKQGARADMRKAIDRLPRDDSQARRMLGDLLRKMGR